MPTINYAKEWKRIANRLNTTLMRLKRQLEAAETEEERNSIRGELRLVEDQIAQASEEATRLTPKDDVADSPWRKR